MTSTLIARRVVTATDVRGGADDAVAVTGGGARGGADDAVAVTIAGGRIGSIEPTARTPDFEVLAPGFIDLQVNGHDDVDVATMTEEQWPRMRRLLLAQGVTTWYPTLVTTRPDRYAERLDHLRRFADDRSPGPTLAGVHLEGPYLGRRHGAHRGVPEGAIDLDWLDALPDLVRIVTLGPERENAVDATRLLASRGTVVALGHTAATYDEVCACVDAGARLFTHCFNAAAALHHRRPGPVGAALGRDDLAISLIADNVHVHPAVLRIAMRCKPEGMSILVTDAAGWRAGRLGSGRIRLRDGAPRLADGTLAGSNLTMDRAVRTAAVDAGIGIEAAIRAATGNPARLLGLADRGAIEVGRRADLVALDASGNVTGIWVGGDPMSLQVG